MKFKRFTKPQFLKSIGRTTLAQLFGKFSTALAAKSVQLPNRELSDDAYFSALATVAMSPETLPDDCIETLFCIEEMANPDGVDRVRRAARQLGLDLKLSDDCSVGDAIAQAFLEKPELVAQQHNEVRLLRLSSFAYHGAKNVVDCSTTFVPPEQAVMLLLAADLDEWFRNNNRGRGNVQIEVYQIDGEYWYLVRHGDMFARMPKLEQGKIEVIHYRPAKDDVVVYSPTRDELRIHADTKSERELYRTTFGHRLRGDTQHFSQPKAYTLDPLRVAGADSLDVTGIAGIERVVLREIEVVFNGPRGEFIVRGANDVFAAAAEKQRQAIPSSGRLARAKFDIYFRGAKKPRPVEIRPPNVLKLRRNCDAAAIHQWLSKNGFRASANGMGAVTVEPTNIVPLLPLGFAADNSGTQSGAVGNSPNESVAVS